MKFTKQEILKRASVDVKFRDTLLQLMKLADGDKNKTSFNESVPAADEQDNQDQLNGQQQMAAPQDNSESAYAQQQQMLPQGQAANLNSGTTPEEMGARAAQAFIGQQVLSAAASGDPGAMDLVSRVAGQIASSVTENAYKEQGGTISPELMNQPQEDSSYVDQNGNPVQQEQVMSTPTPEQMIADAIVAPVEEQAPSPTPPQTPAEPSQQPGQKAQTMQSTQQGNKQPVKTVPQPEPAKTASYDDKKEIKKALLSLIRS